MEQLEVVGGDDVMIVVVPKVVDATVVRRVRALIASAVGIDGIREVAVDLTGVEAFGPDLVAAIDELRRRLRGAGQTLRLDAAPDLQLAE